MRVSVPSLCLVLILLAGAPAFAEDLKGRWYGGFNLSFHSTVDDIRSNAFIISTSQFGDDGLPFTGDPNERTACGGFGLYNDPFCDPRPDDLVAREGRIQETFKPEITLGYGLTDMLSVELDASYFQSDVGPIDVYLRDAIPVTQNPAAPTVLTAFADRSLSTPIAAGKITEIPVSLSFILRFRRSGAWNPYISAGVGMIYTDFDTSGEVGDLNTRMAGFRIQAVGNEYGADITPGSVSTTDRFRGQAVFQWPIKVEVSDAFEWHLGLGVEYFFTNRFSLVFDARYTVANKSVSIDLGGEDQVDLLIFSEELFRPDGSVKIFAPHGVPPNTVCTEAVQNGLPDGYYGCDSKIGDLRFRYVDPQAFPRTENSCPGMGDFDYDGQVDLCYTDSVITSPAGLLYPQGMFVVQGGEIDLTAFAISIGARVHF